jgi:ArsR family transcriptional regulator
MPATAARDVDLLFRAFADGTRRRLLHLMLDGELCVCHLVDLLGVPQPTASRHLAALRRAGLVNVRKDGLWCHYSLAPARGRFHAKLLEALRLSAHEVPELVSDANKGRKLRKTLSCCD